MDKESQRKYLDETVREITKSSLFRKAEELAKQRGYATVFTSGELPWGKQVDLFVHYRVLSKNGLDVEEFDGGPLSAYGALMTKFPRRDWKIQSDALQEFSEDLQRIVELLQRNSFLVQRCDVESGLDQSQPLNCLATVKKTWFSRRDEYAFVDISHIYSDKPAAIGDSIILGGKRYVIIEIG